MPSRPTEAFTTFLSALWFAISSFMSGITVEQATAVGACIAASSFLWSRLVDKFYSTEFDVREEDVNG